MQIIGRSKGRSAVAAAAYRSGGRLTDPRTGTVHDYSRRKGIAHSEILLPEGAAPWLADRQKLWATVEQIEKRKDAQLAREINLALPSELDAEDRLALVRDFVRSQFVSQGMVVDFAIHEPVGEGAGDARNHHAHIMLTLRQATPEGLWRVKTREWNSDSALDGWREAWAAHQNRWLDYRGWSARVDHRTLVAQRQTALVRGDRIAAEGLARLPEIHVGPGARAIVADGREPASCARDVRSRANRPRTRRYPQYDRGSRVHHLIERLDHNLDAFDRKLTRWQQHLMRIRTRRQWLSKAEFASRQTRERELQKRTWLRQKERDAAIAKALRREAHHRRRISQTDVLLQGIDNMLRSLMGLKTNQVKRRHFVRDLSWGRSQGRARGGGRKRTRTSGPIAWGS